MQLGTILDGAKHKPAVVESVKFKVGAENAKAQKTALEASAALVYVSEEELQEILVAVDKSIQERFKDGPLPDREVVENERRIHFFALALRDESDPAKPFAESPDQLRPALVRSVGDTLMEKYRAFVEREYHIAPKVEDISRIKEQAAGK